jgi:hypothetical protein
MIRLRSFYLRTAFLLAAAVRPVAGDDGADRVAQRVGEEGVLAPLEVLRLDDGDAGADVVGGALKPRSGDDDVGGARGFGAGGQGGGGGEKKSGAQVKAS